MSAKYSHTTASAIEWSTATNLVNRLYKDKDYRMSLLIACGCFFGLRISDLLTLTWNQLLDDEFTLVEKKTQKERKIRINTNMQKHIKECARALHIFNKDEHCFISQKHSVYSIQRVNVMLKQISTKYKVKGLSSTHCLRKTFGRHIWELATEQGNGEMALVMLSELFNHSSVAITKRYLGIRQCELLECYDMLSF